MADLSAHLGPIGELFVLLFLFSVLLSMHAPLRRKAVELFHTAYDGCRRTLIDARRKSLFIRSWTDAMKLSIHDRRGYFLISIALVIFDYISTYFLASARIANFLYGGAPNWPDEITGRYLATIYALRAFTYVGYALFGWLAFQRAQGNDFFDAAKFTPIRDVFLFFVFVTALEILAVGVAPIYLYGPSYLVAMDSTFWIPFAKTVLFSAAFTGVSAYLLFFIRQPTKFTHIAYAVIGYILLTHLLQAYDVLMRAPLSGAIDVAFELSMDFLTTVVWTIFYVALCILLGQAALRKNATS